MVLMSDVEGVFTGPPGLDGSRLMHTYCPSLNSSGVRYGAMSRVGSGGMQSKVEFLELLYISLNLFNFHTFIEMSAPF